MLGAVVFSVARKITVEMSTSAIHNLSESLGLVKGTIEAILSKEAEFQKMIAQELTMMEDPESFIRSYNRNRTMARISLSRFVSVSFDAVKISLIIENTTGNLPYNAFPLISKVALNAFSRIFVREDRGGPADFPVLSERFGNVGLYDEMPGGKRGERDCHTLY